MFRNRVKFTTATAGTGSVTVGTASAGFRLPAAAGVSDGEVLYYVIEDGAAWEIGRAIASAIATVLSRELQESSTGALLVLSGSAVMYLTPNAYTLNRLNSRGKLLPLSIGLVSQ